MSEIGVTLDVDCCIGCMACNEIAPDIFGFNDDEEKAFLVKEKGDADLIQEAADTCPEECITPQE